MRLRQWNVARDSPLCEDGPEECRLQTLSPVNTARGLQPRGEGQGADGASSSTPRSHISSVMS